MYSTQFLSVNSEAHPGGRPNVNVDPHVGLIRQRHLRREGCVTTLEALRTTVFADFLQIEE